MRIDNIPTLFNLQTSPMAGILPLGETGLRALNPSTFIYGGQENTFFEGGGDKILLGHPTRELRAEMKTYRDLSPDQKRSTALIYGVESGKIPEADPAWFACSPFAWHAPEFVDLLDDSSLGLNRPDLVIADYGAGSHQVYNFAVKMFHQFNPGKPLPKEYNALRKADAEVFKGQGATLEPKELMALFGSGNKRGHVYIVEQNPQIAVACRDPFFHYINDYEVYAGREDISKGLEKHWLRLSQGRDIKQKPFGMGLGNKIVRARSFRFADDEMARFHFIPADLAINRVNIPGGADLSVWFDSYYFIEPNLSFVAFCRIIQNTKVGGYILADITTTNGGDDVFDYLGIRPLKQLTSTMRGDGISSCLYQKTEEKADVRELASLAIE